MVFDSSVTVATTLRSVRVVLLQETLRGATSCVESTAFFEAWAAGSFNHVSRIYV